MDILKYILISILLFIIPTVSFGQLGRRIILSTGDTVRVVNQRSLLTKQDLDFLRKDTLNKNKILDYTNDYRSIEEAALDLDRLMEEINTSKALSEKNNESLSVRIATRNLRNIKKEQNIQNTWDSIVASEPSVEELTEFYKQFDGKPSYFINGTQVKSQIINKLRTNDILSRNIRTIDTATGNPNGEIWYEVSPQTFQRLNIDEENPIVLPLENQITIPNPVQDSAIETEKAEIEDGKGEIKPESKSDKKHDENKTRSVRKMKENRAQKYNLAN